MRNFFHTIWVLLLWTTTKAAIAHGEICKALMTWLCCNSRTVECDVSTSFNTWTSKASLMPSRNSTLHRHVKLLRVRIQAWVVHKTGTSAADFCVLNSHIQSRRKWLFLLWSKSIFSAVTVFPLCWCTYDVEKGSALIYRWNWVVHWK